MRRWRRAAPAAGGRAQRPCRSWEFQGVFLLLLFANARRFSLQHAKSRFANAQKHSGQSRFGVQERSFLLVRKQPAAGGSAAQAGWSRPSDRKSTRLNSSHLVISYAVFCLKKKN